MRLRSSRGWSLELEDRKIKKVSSKRPELSVQLLKLESNVDSELWLQSSWDLLRIELTFNLEWSSNIMLSTMVSSEATFKIRDSCLDGSKVSSWGNLLEKKRLEKKNFLIRTLKSSEAFRWWLGFPFHAWIALILFIRFKHRGFLLWIGRKRWWMQMTMRIDPCRSCRYTRKKLSRILMKTRTRRKMGCCAYLTMNKGACESCR